MAELAAKAAAFRALHVAGDPVVLCNVWDVSSARAVAKAGYPALATSSAAVARVLGFEDTDSMPPDAAFGMVASIAAAVADRPVTADIEAGYGLPPEEVAERLVAAGAVGCNYEDTDHRGGGMVDAGEQARRIAAIKAAAPDLVVNARVDIAWHCPDDVDELVRRGRLYAEAGADSVYPIGVGDEAALARAVEEIPAPINALLRPGAPSLARLRELGIARVSVGSALSRVAHQAVVEAAGRLLAGDDAPFRNAG